VKKKKESPPSKRTFFFPISHQFLKTTWKHDRNIQHSNHPMQMKEWRVSEIKGQTKTEQKEKKNMAAQKI
jgi:hypothetical protein